MNNSVMPQVNIVHIVGRFIVSLIFNGILTPFIAIGAAFIIISIINIAGERLEWTKIIIDFFSFPLWSYTVEDGDVNLDEIVGVFWFLSFLVTIVFELVKFLIRHLTGHTIHISKKIKFAPFVIISVLFVIAAASCFLSVKIDELMKMILVLTFFWIIALGSYGLYLTKLFIPLMSRRTLANISNQTIQQKVNSDPKDDLVKYTHANNSIPNPTLQDQDMDHSKITE